MEKQGPRFNNETLRREEKEEGKEEGRGSLVALLSSFSPPPSNCALMREASLRLIVFIAGRVTTHYSSFIVTIFAPFCKICIGCCSPCPVEFLWFVHTGFNSVISKGI